MPTYVYRCSKCGHQLETVQRMTEDPLKDCPQCDGELVRLLFPPGIVFKGSGFHVNDYPRSGSGSAGSAKTESAPAKTESKEPDSAAASKN
mgnify:CR=1 FL=1